VHHLTTGAGLVRGDDGRFRDRINDDFAFAAVDDTLVLEPPHLGVPRRPRAFPHVRYVDWLERPVWWAARARQPDERDVAAGRKLVARLRERSPLVDDAIARDVTSFVDAMSRALPLLDSVWRRFFDRCEPRVLFVEDGSYGARATLLRLADRLGIATAEIQHGMITPSHFAYNAAASVRRSSTMAPCWPRTLLVWGALWQRQVSTPSDIVVVGNPAMAAARAASVDRDDDAGGDVLVVSQPGETRALVEFAVALRHAGAPVIFRPHPAEVVDGDAHAALAAAHVSVAAGVTALTLLQRCRAVVGVYSTLLFEAAALGRRVFIVDGPMARFHMPPEFGRWVTDADEVVDDASRSNDVAADDAFADDWRARYLRFVAAHR
jgi:hypothetical protein